MGQRVEQSGTDGGTARPLWLDRVSHAIGGLSRNESVGLIAGDRAAGLEVLNELGRVLDVTPVSITEVGLIETPARSEQELRARLSGCALLFDLEALCWGPWLRLDPLRFLRLLARERGVVALWPGRISGRVATFSEPNRRDRLRVELAELTVLRPVATRFPDDVPFVIERIPR